MQYVSAQGPKLWAASCVYTKQFPACGFSARTLAYQALSQILEPKRDCSQSFLCPAKCTCIWLGRGSQCWLQLLGVSRNQGFWEIRILLTYMYDAYSVTKCLWKWFWNKNDTWIEDKLKTISSQFLKLKTCLMQFIYFMFPSKNCFFWRFCLTWMVAT